MRLLIMFITAVCVLFLIKLRWPKNKSIYNNNNNNNNNINKIYIALISIFLFSSAHNSVNYLGNVHKYPNILIYQFYYCCWVDRPALKPYLFLDKMSCLSRKPIILFYYMAAIACAISGPEFPSTVFIRLNAAAFIKFFLIRVRRLFEGGVYTRAAFI